MIEHLVLFRFNADVGAEHVTKTAAALAALTAAIPEIRELSAGPNFSPRGQGYQLGLRVLFADKAALSVYQTHPAHVAVVKTYVAGRAELVVCDYER